LLSFKQIMQRKRILAKDAGLKFQRTVKMKKRPSGPPESALQNKVEDYLDHLGIRFIHVPDCVVRQCAFDSPTPIHVKHIISKYLKGIPDVVVFQDDRVLLVELKRKNAKARQSQKKWLKGLTHHVVDNWAEAKAIIDEFNGGNE